MNKNLLTKDRENFTQILIVIFLLLSLCGDLYAEEQIEENIKQLSSIDPENSEEEDTSTVAPNIDLKDVTPPPEPVVEQPQEETKTKEETSVAEEKPVETETSQPLIDKLVILGSEVNSGTSTRLAWSPQVTISGLSIPTPVLVIKGIKAGPTVCLTSATHGDELNGIEVVRRVMYDIDAEKLSGTLIGVPIVNLQGFQRGSRYLSDRRDLNRFFPGNANGSLASRIANSLFTEVINHCDFLIDIHTGSLRRTNLPQIRADMTNEKIVEFVEGFDKIAVVHHKGNLGMLRTAANANGIVAITMELGESLRIQESQIAAGTYGVNSLLDKLEMYPRMFIWGDPKPAYYEALWLRVESGGILFNEKNIGDNVNQGDVLGAVTDPITNQKKELVSPVKGRIIGMAVNQVVVPGFAAYHIGRESTQEDITKVSGEELDQLDDIGMDEDLIDPE